jgi:uncharacterized membrane protein
MTSFRILLFFHIAAVVVGFGVTFALPFMQAFAERTGPGATRFMLRFARRLETMVIYPGAVLIFIFGLGLMFDDNTGYKDDMPAWLTISTIWFVVAVGMGFLVLRRAVAQALAALDGVPDDGEFPPAYLALSRRIQVLGGLLGVSIVGIAFLMVWGANGGF